MNTLDQRRAKHALDSVKEWKSGLDKKSERGNKKDPAQRVKDLPLMVRNLGLGQTLAILIKEGKEKEKENDKRKERKQNGELTLAETLTSWLLVDGPIKAYPGITEAKPYKLMEACFNGTREQYQLAQQEALAYLGWLKIMAEAMVEEQQ